MQSFLHSHKLGAIIETDVRIMKDGKILISHDPTFDRLCQRSSLKHKGQKIIDTLSTELPTFKEDMPLHFSKEAFYRRKEGDQNTYTLLEDVFKVLPREQVIQIDIKDTDNEDAVRNVLALVYKYDRQQTTIVGCLNPSLNELIRKINPNVPTFCDWSQAIKLYLGFLTGLLPYMAVNFDSCPVPFMTRDLVKMRLTENKNKLAGFLNVLGVLVVNSTANPILRHLNKRGVFTSYWVINDDDEIQYALKNSEVQGILTDRPAYVKDFDLHSSIKF